MTHRMLRNVILAGLAVWLAACAPTTAGRERALVGRWHRVAEGLVGDPFQTLAGEYFELRPQGMFVGLDYISGPQTFWTMATGRYSIPDTDQITITGKCWHGWDSYACTQTYRYELKGDDLTVFGEGSQASPLAYHRIGAIGPDLPPTLVPPMPSPPSKAAP